MCGIVGLFLKDPALEPRLGAMAAGMLTVLSDRGPDSAGFAIYGAGAKDTIKLTLRDPAGGAAFDTLDLPLHRRGDHAVLTIPAEDEAALRARLARTEIRIVGAGESMELYKAVGHPSDVAARFGLPNMSGTHAIGHTRMATESAVTTAGAHPFSTGRDQCLVHNGSLSNHNGVRRSLRAEGLEFETENDSEVAAGYLTWRMRQGARLDEALYSAINDLDGFYTFVVGTQTGFGVLRDPIACKPAVMAETDRYVAFGSEYRALVDLPDIARAHIWEPEPAKVYFWQRN